MNSSDLTFIVLSIGLSFGIALGVSRYYGIIGFLITFVLSIVGILVLASVAISLLPKKQRPNRKNKK